MAYRRNELGYLFNPKLIPFPSMPVANAWLLAFQTDKNHCRTKLFIGITEGIRKHHLDRFNPVQAVALKDDKYIVLSAPSSNPYFFMPFRKVDKGHYQIDFLSLLLFSMEARASILLEVASYAEGIGKSEDAIEYFRLVASLKNPYRRVQRLICNNPYINVKQSRKDEIAQQIQEVERASNRLETFTARNQQSLTAKSYLPNEDYERILKIATNMSVIMEQRPEAFSSLKEEHIRDHFIVQLNGHFPGNVAAETFNYYGKTDILIRRGNDNIFVAECKFWEGAAAFSEAIDQLLRYATWRDTRLALFIFNRRKNLSNVLDQIRSALQQHSAFLREEAYDNERGFRAYLAHRADPERQLLTTILVFDLPNDK